jgi:hypothetical protein
MPLIIWENPFNGGRAIHNIAYKNKLGENQNWNIKFFFEEIKLAQLNWHQRELNLKLQGGGHSRSQANTTRPIQVCSKY